MLSYPWLNSKNLDLRLYCCCITTTEAYVILSLLDSTDKVLGASISFILLYALFQDIMGMETFILPI